MMNRLDFIKALAGGSLGLAAAMSGVSEGFIQENLKEDKDYFYVELPHIPGTRFVFAKKEDVEYHGLIVGSIKPELDQVQQFYGKGLYAKNLRGEFVPYENIIDPLITNGDIKNLRDNVRQSA